MGALPTPTPKKQDDDEAPGDHFYIPCSAVSHRECEDDRHKHQGSLPLYQLWVPVLQPHIQGQVREHSWQL